MASNAYVVGHPNNKHVAQLSNQTAATHKNTTSQAIHFRIYDFTHTQAHICFLYMFLFFVRVSLDVRDNIIISKCNKDKKFNPP